jgi:hypothetical protein
MAASNQDPRASAAKADVPAPCLLYTYLGRVSSRGGRELERALAVKVSTSGKPEVYLTADQWSQLADPAKAIRTTDLWKKHFESWAKTAGDRATKAALASFQPVAKAFVDERTASLKQEQQGQQEWLRKRSQEITGTGVATAVQLGLFDAAKGPDGKRPAAWQTLDDPAERLAAFASDGNQTPSKRSEADGVLRIYRQRMAILENLLAVAEPEVIPLGVLMLMPEKG